MKLAKETVQFFFRVLGEKFSKAIVVALRERRDLYKVVGTGRKLA